jgi:Asp-tRNA(Asn)/Glu-tRNA(Gln) amidotransferase A subunit family amidase
LHGIPYGAKDLLAKKGYKTTWGAAPYKDQTLDLDATVVRKLEKAGAVLCAKMTLGALAMGDVWFGGMTRNPWNIEAGSSGSSAGVGIECLSGFATLCYWHRNSRFYCLSFNGLRHHGSASNLWAGEPTWSHGVELEYG